MFDCDAQMPHSSSVPLPPSQVSRAVAEQLVGDEQVVSIAAAQGVDAGARERGNAAEENVVARAAVDGVGVVSGVDHVRPVAAQDGVGATRNRR